MPLWFSKERLRNGGPHPGYVDVAAAASFKRSVGIPQKNGKPDVPSRTYDYGQRTRRVGRGRALVQLVTNKVGRFRPVPQMVGEGPWKANVFPPPVPLLLVFPPPLNLVLPTLDLLNVKPVTGTLQLPLGSGYLWK